MATRKKPAGVESSVEIAFIKKQAIPPPMDPQMQQWRDLLLRAKCSLEAAERSCRPEDQEAATISGLDAQRQLSLRVSIGRFCRRYPDLISGFRLRTQCSGDKLYIWVEREKGRK